MNEIYKKLKKYCNEDYVPMHMPGHKRNTNLFEMENPYNIDITEIDGFDNLHNPKEIILESMEKAAELYNSENTFYLINGTSAGILTAISAVAKRRDKVLVARNSHKSVYNALYLNELNPIYIYPQGEDEIKESLGICENITAQQVDDLLHKNKDVKAVIITSPTYEGIVSDIRRIADVAHSYNIPLIVDEAHGAHFQFSKEFPEPALLQGADVVIQSIHKTLPAFTQTAIMHVNGNFVNIERIKYYLSIFQTTSPSYILMTGIDNCISWLEENGEAAFEEHVKMLLDLRQNINTLKCIKLLDTDDISKIVIYLDTDICNLNGKALYDILLEKYHIQLEMASEYYVIAMTSVADLKDYYERFLAALKQIDNELINDVDSQGNGCGNFNRDENIYSNINDNAINLFKAQIYCNMYDAINAESIVTDLTMAEGRISASSICVYPPGIPVVNPGELITNDIIRYIESSLQIGLSVIGLNQNNRKEVKIKCLK